MGDRIAQLVVVPVMQVELEWWRTASHRNAPREASAIQAGADAVSASAWSVSERYCAVACETAGAGCVAAARGALGSDDCEWIECSSR